MTTNFEDAVQAMTALKQEWGIKEWSELIRGSREVIASNIVISGEYLAAAGAGVPVRVRCIDGCVADGYIDENGTVMLYDDEYNDITEGGVFYTLKLHASAKTIHLGRIYNAEPDNSIELKIDGGGNLEFRDKIIYNGASYVPIGAVGELALINTAPGGLSGTYLQTHNLNMLGAQGCGDSIFAPVPYNWEPVGTLGSRFEGGFDGGGKDIENLYIHKPDEDNTGLFGVVGKGGSIKGINIRSGVVTGHGYAGSVAGRNYGRVEHCCNYGTVAGRFRSGGVVGWNREGTVTACCNAGKIFTNTEAGGVVGHNPHVTIIACRNTGEVHAIRYAGGVVGTNTRGTVTASYNTGKIAADVSYAGGIVGGAHKGTVTACYNTGKISVDVNYAGGIMGDNWDGAITACRNTGEVHASSYAGGVVGRNHKGTVTACYNTGKISAGGSYAGGVVGYNESETSPIYYPADMISFLVPRYYAAHNRKGHITACYNTGEISAVDGNGGGIAGDGEEHILACYHSGAIISCKPCDAGTEFSAEVWPSSKQSNQWGTGSADGTPGNYWKSLGGWGGAPAGTTVYPVLWWE